MYEYRSNGVYVALLSSLVCLLLSLWGNRHTLTWRNLIVWLACPFVGVTGIILGLMGYTAQGEGWMASDMRDFFWPRFIGAVVLGLFASIVWAVVMSSAEDSSHAPS